RRFGRRPAVALLEVFQGHARRQPHRPLLLFGREVHTYGEVERRSNRAARALAALPAVRQGVAVAVFLPNCPAYVWTWLALAKLGCPMACLNTNARGAALRHAVAAAGAAVLLADAGE
ncbi:S27A2 synthetase, partial [Trogon melanurus]|nr:S27A2 synthetase [Trogon melanurus]